MKAIDPNSIKIDKDVPIAKNSAGRPKVWDVLLNKMEVGDSVLLADSRARHFQNSTIKSKTFKIVMRREGTCMRCWKTTK